MFKLRLFKGKLKPLQASRIKRKYGWGLSAYAKCRPLWLPKKNCQLKSPTMARSSFNICRGR